MSDRRKQIKLMSRANEERKFVYCLLLCTNAIRLHKIHKKCTINAIRVP